MKNKKIKKTFFLLTKTGQKYAVFNGESNGALGFQKLPSKRGFILILPLGPWAPLGDPWGE